MRRWLVASMIVPGLLALAAATAGPVSADPNNKNTLRITLACGAQGSIDAVFELSSSDAFHLVDISGNFTWKALSFSSSGETITLAGDPRWRTREPGDLHIHRPCERQQLHGGRVLHPAGMRVRRAA